MQNFICPFCSLLCDDIRLEIKNNSFISLNSNCLILKKSLERKIQDQSPRIKGKKTTMTLAIEELAKLITQTLSIPTIGIGAGRYCDGQVQVFHDILGLISGFNPKHAKQYLNLSQDIKKALNQYDENVVNKKFPQKKNTTSCSSSIIKKLK